MLEIVRSQESGQETGTLWNVANILRNSNFKLDPEKDYNKVKFAFVTMLHGYITAATLQHFGVDNVNDVSVPTSISQASRLEQTQWLLEVVQPLVEKFCLLGDCDFKKISTFSTKAVHQCSVCNKQFVYEKAKKNHEKKIHNVLSPIKTSIVNDGEKLEEDGIFNYGSLVITLGLLLVNSDDAVKEGDGDRLFRMYKWWLLLLKQQHSSKYALASLRLQAQVLCFLNEPDAYRLIWNRTVNRRGGLGKRVSRDLHMENLVKVQKQALRHLGSNLSQSQADTEGKALNKIVKLVEAQNKDLRMQKPRGYHRVRPSQDDVETIVQVLSGISMFVKQPGRELKSFPKMKHALFSNFDINTLTKWVAEHMKQWEYIYSKQASAVHQK